MKKVLALVVIAGSVALYSCNNGKSGGDDAAKKAADSTAKADSMKKAQAKTDSMNKAAAMPKDTTKKDTTANKPAGKMDDKGGKMDEKKK